MPLPRYFSCRRYACRLLLRHTLRQPHAADYARYAEATIHDDNADGHDARLLADMRKAQQRDILWCAARAQRASAMRVRESLMRRYALYSDTMPRAEHAARRLCAMRCRHARLVMPRRCARCFTRVAKDAEVMARIRGQPPRRAHAARTMRRFDTNMPRAPIKMHGALYGRLRPIMPCRVTPCR